MADDGLFEDPFTKHIINATDAARRQMLEAGIPVFYFDERLKIEILEQPDGRKFEIRYISGVPATSNFEIVRELSRSAA